MHAYDREQILSAFRAATRSEVKQVTFAANFDIVDFEALDYYGWADPKTPPDVPQGHRPRTHTRSAGRRPAAQGARIRRPSALDGELSVAIRIVAIA